MKLYNGIGILSLLILCFGAPHVTNGQLTSSTELTTAQQSLEIETIEKGTTLKAVLSKLEKNYDVKFFYKSGLMVNKNFTEQQVLYFGNDVFDVLDRLLTNFGFSYKVLAHRTIGITPERKSSKQDEQPEAEVSGTVTDAQSGEAIPAVNIGVQGTSTGTTTDANGNYSIQVENPEEASLVFSFVGYQVKTIPVNGRSEINVTLEPKVTQLEEVVAVGYQTQQRADVTGAIDVVNAEDLANTSSSNPLKSLQGKMPGVYLETSGAPGAGANLTIRGLSTLGNNSPLFIIDGMPTKSGIVNNLSPEDIESVQVLKDAAASSIYGARASNGVVIIQTKSGARDGQGTNITFESRVTTQKYQNAIDVLSTKGRGRALWRAQINEGNDPNNRPLYDYEWHYDDQGIPVLDEVIPVERYGPENIKSANTDWWEEVTRPGLITRNSLSMSTSGPQGSARYSVNYLTNKGTFIKNKYDRFSTRINSSYSFLDNAIEIGENVMVSRSNNSPDHVRGGALSVQSIIPVYTEDGGWGGPSGAGFEDWNQPVMLAHLNQWDSEKETRIMGNVYVDVNFLDDFQFRSNIGIDYNNSQWIDIQRPYKAGFMSREDGDLTQNSSEYYSWNFSNTLSYNIDFGKHTGSILAGTEINQERNSWLDSYAQEFALDLRDYYYMDAATGTQNIGGSATGFQLLSYFGKLNYQFAKKYLMSATLRYDGSSRFGENKRFGLFPAFSFGWRMDQENFIKNNFDFISTLKPRYGYGTVGNQEIANDASLALYESLYGQDYTWHWDESTSYDLAGNDSGTLPSGFRRLKSGNPNLKWESTTEHNFGLDFGFFDQKINGSLDYFFRESEDILISPPYLGVVGEGGSRWVNGATVENKGWELTLQYRDIAGELGYSISANAGHFKDEITYLPPNVVKAYPGNVEKTILGRSQRAFFGYVTDGLFDTEQEVQEHAEQPGKDLGRIRYKDLNGDGVISSRDQKYLGNSLPNLTYGLNLQLDYKNWALDVFLNGEQGKNVYNSVKMQTDFVFRRAGINYGTRVLDAWTPQNKDTEIPALITSNKNREFRSSDYYIEDGSYMKLRNVGLSYTFNEIQLVNNLRIYLRGENLVVVKSKDYAGPDPENPNTEYGRPRKVTLGLSISL